MSQSDSGPLRKERFHPWTYPCIPPLPNRSSAEKRVFLGIHFKPSLVFNLHIKTMVQKPNKATNVFLRSLKTSSITVLLKAYEGYILPVLEYGSEIWSPGSIGLMNDIESVQRNFTIGVYARAGFTPIDYLSRLKFLSLTTLEYRRIIFDFSFVHKTINENVIIDNSSHFKIRPLPYSPRISHVLRIVLSFKMPESHHTCASRCIDIWNSLPSSIRSSSQFKDALLHLPNDKIVPSSKLRLA